MALSATAALDGYNLSLTHVDLLAHGNEVIGENGALRRNDYLEKSLDRNTTGRAALNCSSKNFRDARSSITLRNRIN